MLYLTEPIDEPAVNAIGEFEEFKFADVTREGLDLGDVPEEDKKKVGRVLLPRCHDDPGRAGARLHPQQGVGVVLSRNAQ